MKSLFGLSLLFLAPFAHAQISVYSCDVIDPVVTQSEIDEVNYEFYQSCIVFDNLQFYEFGQSVKKKITAIEKIEIFEGFRAGPFNKKGELELNIKPRQIDIALMNHTNLDIIPVRDKFELGINLPDSIMNLVDDFIQNGAQPGNINPFDPEDIDIRADFYFFLSDQWQGPYLQYGFYYEEFERDLATSTYTPLNVGEYPFRIRYTPTLITDYKCVVTITLPGSQPIVSDEIFFKVVPSGRKNSVRIGANKRYFMRGMDPIFLAGQNLPFPGDGEGPWSTQSISPQKFLDFHNVMADYKQSGGNYFRMLISPWGYEIEFEKIGDYSDRMSNAWELDQMLDAAKLYDLLIHFNMQVHYPLENPSVYAMVGWDWPKYGDPVYNPVCAVEYDNGYCYASQLGLNSPVEFLTDAEVQKYYKKKLRYILSRWAYSTNIAVIELFSEVNNLGQQADLVPEGNGCVNAGTLTQPYKDINDVPAKVAEWQNEMCRYIKQDLRMLHHPLAVNYTGSPSRSDAPESYYGCSVGEGDFSYYSDYVDVWTYNHYGMAPDKYAGQTETFHSFRNPPPPVYPLKLKKPLLYSETGSEDNCDRFISEMKGVLLSPFTGAAGSGLPWAYNNNTGEYQDVAARHAFYNLQKNVAAFFEGVPLDEEEWFPGTDVRNDKKADLLYLKKGTSGHKKAMGAVHNRTVNYYTYGTKDSLSECFKTAAELADFHESYRDPINVNPGGIFSGDLLKIPNMGTHLYAIQWYNPFTNQAWPVIYQSSDVFGNLYLHYPTLQSNLDHSILYFKVWKWNQSFLPQQPTGYQKEDIYVQSGSFTNENEDLSVYDHDPQEERVFSVHPNPANKGCTIVLNGTCSTNAKIYISNALGVVIREINVESNDVWVDLSECASGIYLIYLEDDCYMDFVKLIKK